MEIYIFFITIGSLISLLLIMIGIYIGKGLSYAERISERKLRDTNNSNVLCSSCNNKWNRDLGNDDGK